MQKHYKVLKQFSSPLVGNAMEGDIISYGTEMAQQWVDAGLVEEVKQETKPSKTRDTKKTK